MDVPYNYAWARFTHHMGWDYRTLGVQPCDFVHLQWSVYQLDCKYGTI